ncbi:hypothetical protein BH09PSE1_BH09PSE1_15280 [soil metagenome]
MARQQLQETEAPRTASAKASKREYPVREYIAGMTQELAQMARWDGDEVLAGLLEAATLRAEGARP